jgi:hypothetical protein
MTQGTLNIYARTELAQGETSDRDRSMALRSVALSLRFGLPGLAFARLTVGYRWTRMVSRCGFSELHTILL